VRELAGGTQSVAFSYRIVGRRKDIKGHRRFAKIDMRLPPLPRARPQHRRGGRKCHLQHRLSCACSPPACRNRRGRRWRSAGAKAKGRPA